MTTNTLAFFGFFHAYFLEHALLILADNVDKECWKFSNDKSSTSRCCLEFAWFFANFSLALLIKEHVSEMEIFANVRNGLNPLAIFFK